MLVEYKVTIRPLPQTSHSTLGYKSLKNKQKAQDVF